MHRFYADETAETSDTFLLSPEDAHHALHVLRMKPGDEAEVFASGNRYLAVFTELSPACARLKTVRPLPSAEPSLSVTLFQGLPKFDKMEWIVQKGVELGVSGIVPVPMIRSVSKPDEKNMRNKTERWRKIAREAGKQAGRCVLPDIADPVPLSGLRPYLDALDAVVVPWEECSSPGPKAWSETHPGIRSLGIVIGPEGGIAPEEIRFLRELRCEPITLGPRILRTETAGIASVSAFLSLYGEME